MIRLLTPPQPLVELKAAVETSLQIQIQAQVNRVGTGRVEELPYLPRIPIHHPQLIRARSPPLNRTLSLGAWEVWTMNLRTSRSTARR